MSPTTVFMRNQARLLALLLVCLFVLPACSSGETQKGSRHLSVQMTEFAFQPTRFTVPAGAEVTLDLSNNGAIEHNFIVMNPETQVTPPFDEDDEANVYWQVAVSPGSSVTTTFMSPADPGEYQVVCKTPGHVEAGMVGTLAVVAP